MHCAPWPPSPPPARARYRAHVAFEAVDLPLLGQQVSQGERDKLVKEHSCNWSISQYVRPGYKLGRRPGENSATTARLTPLTPLTPPRVVESDVDKGFSGVSGVSGVRGFDLPVPVLSVSALSPSTTPAPAPLSSTPVPSFPLSSCPTPLTVPLPTPPTTTPPTASEDTHKVCHPSRPLTSLVAKRLRRLRRLRFLRRSTFLHAQSSTAA